MKFSNFRLQDLLASLLKDSRCWGLQVLVTAGDIDCATLEISKASVRYHDVGPSIRN